MRRLIAALLAGVNAANKHEKIYQILGGGAWFTGDRTFSGITLNPETEIEAFREASYYENGQPRQFEVKNLLDWIVSLHSVNRHRSGHFRLPARVPEDITNEGSPQIWIRDEMSWQEWLLKQLDAMNGSYPIKIKYKDGMNPRRSSPKQVRMSCSGEL